MPYFSALNPQLKIHYLDSHPEGLKGVLLLHGLGVNSASWQLQIPDLVSAGFRTIAPDARGFGASTYPGGRLRVADMAGDAAALIRHLQAESGLSGPVHVVGISMGGAAALQLALDHPCLVDKLVLVNTFARLRLDSLRVWAYFTLRFVLVHTLGLEVQANAVSRRIFPHPGQEPLRQAMLDQIVQADPRGYRAAMRALARFNVASRLGQVSAPTLVITGATDSTIPPETQSILAKDISGARQVIIPGAGHAVTAEAPETFNRLLLDFLCNNPAPSIR